jgi:3',5'-cyclic AMP phosphodiesterase CpdA
MENDIFSPFVRSSNPLIARWQSAVMKTVADRIKQQQPELLPHEVQALALKDPMVVGTNMHVLSDKGKLYSSVIDSAAAANNLSGTDAFPLHIKHYYASKHFYNLAVFNQLPTNPQMAAEALKAGGADDRPWAFPDTDSNYKQWAIAAAEWEAFANPYPSPYRDWETKVPAGVKKEDFIKTFAVFTIPDNARVAILGDFGTGLTDGILMLMSVLINQQPDFIIHIGDIYYAGMGSETDAYVNMFSEAFRRTGKKVPVFSLPGNHEYMCGGGPFFDKVLKMNAANGFPQYAQNASYFCLRNKSGNLQFLGMDTGLNSVDALLPTGLTSAYAPWLWFSEAAWCVDKLETFKKSGGKTILLSHHQLYSVSGEINDGSNVVYVTGIQQKTNLRFLNGNLFNIFSPYFDQVAAWYWGHEHLLGIYKNNELTNSQGVPLKKGRLVGNSGYEQWDRDGGYAAKTDRFHYIFPNVQVDITSVTWAGPLMTNTTNFYNHGWALLNVAGSAITANYWEFPVMSPDITTLPPVGSVPPPTSLNFSENL